MERLYHRNGIISRAKKYFWPYIELLTRPSGHKLFMLLLAALSMQMVTSVQHIWKWFLRGMSKVSLNAYYYLLTYTEMPIEKFAAVTVRKAVGLIGETEAKLPVLLLLDDTLQAKFGTHFECYSTMHDHARHNGSEYLKGHCFVALTICVPVAIGNTVKYLNVPVRFRMRGTDENKLTIASEMIAEAMAALKDMPMVVLLCDSWYPKGEVLKTVEAYENLELVANARIDTAMFDLPERTGKRGRPPTKGKKLGIYDDFCYTLVGDYYTAARTVLTNLFKRTVYVTVTTPNLDNHGSYRLFISTVSADTLNALFADHENLLHDGDDRQPWLFPLYLYSFRWNIEVMFYELKTFWSFGNYRLRSKIGVESLINIISLSYTCSKLLPLADSSLADASPQATKYALADAIRRDLFFADFLTKLENDVIFFPLLEILRDSDLFKPPV